MPAPWFTKVTYKVIQGDNSNTVNVTWSVINQIQVIDQTEDGSGEIPEIWSGRIQ